MEKTGVLLKIVPVTASDYSTKMNALYAAGDMPDIFGAFSLTKREMVEDGALLPLNDLINEYAPHIKQFFADNPDLQRTMVDGEIYTLPMMRMDENWEKGCVPMIRVDLLEKNGIAKPTTWAGLVDVLEQLHTIYPDMVPWGARGQNRLIGLDSLSWVTSFGADYNPYIDEQGLWHMGRIESEYKDVVTFLNDMINRGILDSEYLTTAHQTWIEGLSSGEFMFWYDNPVFAAQVNPALATVDPDARFEPLEILENPYGYIRNYQQPTNYVDEYYFSADTKDPVLLIKFMDWAYSTEGMYTFNYGRDGETYSIDASGDPQWLPEVLAAYAGNDNAYYAVQSDFGILNNNFSPAWLNLCVEVFRSGSGDTNTVDAKYVYNFYKDNTSIYEKTKEPPLSEEQDVRIREIKQEINDYSATEINKFVMGVRPLEEYDSFVQELIDKGAQEWADILNEAEQTYQALIAQ
ncbi:MAG: extracellular solute-binding protein [Eubacteriales bacterium]|nr:extracellular solute-binding protein [Eubacteriales bacterium]